MRKVLGSHAQTAHVWAQGIQRDGRANDSRMFFEDWTLYSYGHHFAIASHVTDLKGNHAILFTTECHSISTGKHISLTRQALRPEIPVFYVPNPRPNHEAKNLEKIDREIDWLLHSYARPRIRQATRDKIAGEVLHLINSRNVYGEAFVKLYKRVHAPDNISELAESLRAAREKQARAEETARKRAFEKEVTEAETFLKLPRTEWADIWRLNNEGIFSDYAHSQAARKVVYQYVREKHGILLRPKGKSTIETSAHADFPATHARKAFKFIAQQRAKREAWHKNGHSIHLGHYQIDEITKHGDVKAGCHFVKWEEIELCARKCGFEV